MVRAGLRYSFELRMNARAVTTDVLLGIVPIALLVALWQAIASFGYAPVSLLPPPGLVFMRLAQQLFTSTFQHEIGARSEEHTSELPSHVNLVCRLLLEKKKAVDGTMVLSAYQIGDKFVWNQAFPS